jgi:hypothetical protein
MKKHRAAPAHDSARASEGFRKRIALPPAHEKHRAEPVSAVSTNLSSEPATALFLWTKRFVQGARLAARDLVPKTSPRMARPDTADEGIAQASTAGTI